MLYNELEQGDILSGVRWRLALLAYTDILLCSIWAMRRIRQTPVIDMRYTSDLTNKYQKLFVRYQESLFTFIDQDGIPWHNNTAERAIRHISKQRAISTNFHASVMNDYLILLGIRQACRFQGTDFSARRTWLALAWVSARSPMKAHIIQVLGNRHWTNDVSS